MVRCQRCLTVAPRFEKDPGLSAFVYLLFSRPNTIMVGKLFAGVGYNHVRKIRADNAGEGSGKAV
jgi:hypothetical protein